MSEEQINIAIAEACGWTILETPIDDHGYASYAKDPNGCPCPGIPDYCRDLNAMHEAEETLELQDAGRYADDLRDVVLLRTRLPWVDAGSFAHIYATARQRAEAFLRTIGKWKEAAK